MLEGGYRWRLAGSYRNESFKAFVRCCSDDDKSCPGISNCEDSNEATSYDDAVAQCLSIGKRLCTRDELWNKTTVISNSKPSAKWTCCGTEPQCKNAAVWTSDTISGNRI